MTKTSEIIPVKCNGLERLYSDSCRDCDGLHTRCPDYIPSRQTKILEQKPIGEQSSLSIIQGLGDKTADIFYSQIRKYNDGGVI
jgi:hypothetical protein